LPITAKALKDRCSPARASVFSRKPHIKAEEFGPTASYGYGIAVDTLDGHKILRHTGGMVSFASSMHVDIDDGVGAFASINAMQGYRPNPVAQYAMQLMRAKRGQHILSGCSAAEFANGNKKRFRLRWEISERGEGATLKSWRPVKVSGCSIKASAWPWKSVKAIRSRWRTRISSDFALVFGRADEKDPKSPVVEAGLGGEWFTNSRYTGPKTLDYPKEWDQYVGHYRNESPWVGSTRILVFKGKLMADGVVGLEPGPDGVFHFAGRRTQPGVDPLRQTSSTGNACTQNSQAKTCGE
jgi:D-alanyl-D-alanine carboxypeptidase